jgi:hypothetical protein
MSRRITTVRGLLDAAARKDLPDYIADRRVNPHEDFSPAERELVDLHRRGLVKYEGSLDEVEITTEGRTHLAKLERGVEDA